MNDHFANIGRCVSIFDRLMKMYYDRSLSEFEIGWGQQFYVEYLYEHPGATPQEMTECIRVDKATLTKIIKKLTEVDYIKIMENNEIKPNENPLGTEPIGKLILNYSLPAITSSLVSAIYNIVDQIFVGQKIGELGNAATNVSFPHFGSLR